MKKFNFTLLVCLLLAGIFASCDDTESESRKSAANHTELVRQRK